MAMNLNKAMVIGNLTRDPEARTTPSGQNVCSFGVATSRRWKDQASGALKEDTQFHNIVAWGRLAETCSQYLKKGSKVYVEGRLQYRQWEDQSGAKRNRTEIVADTMIMLDRKGEGGGSGSAQPPAASRQPKTDSNAEEVSVEDIPF
ncbi:MAG: single-stranded DNA-binding protein [Candidatus Kerfeldbacteria bacterium]|nr:single-stranded DNA-binding protein [Candidatus Kerfeldbacteria bacterium]